MMDRANISPNPFTPSSEILDVEFFLSLALNNHIEVVFGKFSDLLVSLWNKFWKSENKIEIEILDCVLSSQIWGIGAVEVMSIFSQ